MIFFIDTQPWIFEGSLFNVNKANLRKITSRILIYIVYVVLLKLFPIIFIPRWSQIQHQ